MEMRLRGVNSKNIAEEYLLVSHLINKERERSLYYELIAMAGMNNINKDAVVGIKRMLMETMRPELGDIDKQQTDQYASLLAEEAKKTYNLTYGGNGAMSDAEVAMAFNNK